MSDSSIPSEPTSVLARLIQFSSTIGSLLVFGIMSVIVMDILGRYLLNRPLPGAAELVVISITAIVFLQAPGALRSQRLILSDGFLNFVGKRSVRAQQWLLASHHLLGAIMFVLIAYFVWPLLSRVFQSDDYYGVLGYMTFPKWPVYLIILAGSILMTLQYAVLAVAFFKAGVSRRMLFDATDMTLQGHGDVNDSN